MLSCPCGEPIRSKRNRKYCSKECLLLYHPILQRRVELVARVCEHCGNQILVYPSTIKGGRGRFCSKRCLDQWRSVNQRGPAHHQWNRITKSCEYCGEIIYVQPNTLRWGWGRFCSRLCLRKSLIKLRPTKPEARFSEITKNLRLPFRYVGDGTFWIGRINPDFIDERMRVVVEIFGDYWHSPLLNRHIEPISVESVRRAILARSGWMMVVFWEHEVMNPHPESIVLSRLAGMGYLQEVVRYS